MKSYELDHAQNIVTLGTGVMLTATALTSFSFLLGFNVLFEFPDYLNPALTVLLALCVGFAMASRVSMIDLWKTMEHNTRLALIVFLGLYFALTSMAPGHFSPFAGLVALHVPAALTLVSDRGFARLYILTGLTSAFAVLNFLPHVAACLLAVYGLLLFLTLSYENFFFRLLSQPVSTPVSGWLPLLLAASRYILFAAPAWLLWRFVPTPPPFLFHPSDVDREQQRQRPISDPASFNASLVKAFLYTMALILLLLGLIAMLRYLHSKFRRKGGELLPESIGVPVGSLQKLSRAENQRTERGNDPLAQIVKEYERFSTALRSDLAQRAPSQTPEEFATRLRNLAAIPGPLLSDITAEFSTARYAPQEVTWETAERFTGLIEQAVHSDDDAEKPA
ncbi:MAG: DUF4129 domain-containing protein [Candidatus Sumerlaeaceae bacterium]